jgi:hypothetical protein
MKSILTITLLAVLAVRLSAAESQRFITYSLDIEIENSERSGGDYRPSEVYHEPESLPADQDPAGNWGEPSGGLQLSIRFDKEKYAPGEPIFITVLLRNTTEAEISTLIHGELLGADLEVLNSSGESMMTRAEAQSKSAFSRSLQKLVQNPGVIPIPAGYQRRRVVDLSRIYSLEPGRYSVTAARSFHHSPNGPESFEIKSKPAILLLTDRSGAIPEGRSSAPESQPTTNHGRKSAETNGAVQNRPPEADASAASPMAEAAIPSQRNTVSVIVGAGLLFAILLFAFLKKKRSH